jgi:hypothetical protein
MIAGKGRGAFAMTYEALRTAKYWRARADEARARAEEMQDGIAKETMLDVAKKYGLLARLAAEREGRIATKKPPRAEGG